MTTFPSEENSVVAGRLEATQQVASIFQQILDRGVPMDTLEAVTGLSETELQNLISSDRDPGLAAKITLQMISDACCLAGWNLIIRNL